MPYEALKSKAFTSIDWKSERRCEFAYRSVEIVGVGTKHGQFDTLFDRAGFQNHVFSFQPADLAREVDTPARIVFMLATAMMVFSPVLLLVTLGIFQIAAGRLPEGNEWWAVFGIVVAPALLMLAAIWKDPHPSNEEFCQELHRRMFEQAIQDRSLAGTGGLLLQLVPLDDWREFALEA